VGGGRFAIGSEWAVSSGVSPWWRFTALGCQTCSLLANFRLKFTIRARFGSEPTGPRSADAASLVADVASLVANAASSVTV
jgi:hypothetical protein